MALAFSTLVVLLLLLPGLLVIPGVYRSDKVSRDAVPQGILAQLAILIVAATLIHLLLFLAINKLLVAVSCWGPPLIDLKIVLRFATLGSGTAASAVDVVSDLAANIEDYAFWILLYFAVASFLGFVLGYLVGRLIVSGSFRFLASNAWIFDVLSPAHKAAHEQVHAYVVSNIEHEGKRILYTGRIYHCQYGADGKLIYLVLSGARRGLVQIEKDAVKIVGADEDSEWPLLEEANIATASKKSDKSPRPNVLFIDGSEIANVYFTPIPWRGRITEQALDDLEKKVEEAARKDAAFAPSRPLRFRERFDAQKKSMGKQDPAAVRRFLRRGSKPTNLAT